jgi:hypothetical protein
MTFHETLQAHKGGLIQLKTQIYWYKGRGYDRTPGRICLLLDAALLAVGPGRRAHAATAAAALVPAALTGAATEAAFLLIDGQPQWIWVAEEDIALLVNDPPTN